MRRREKPRKGRSSRERQRNRSFSPLDLSSSVTLTLTASTGKKREMLCISWISPSAPDFTDACTDAPLIAKLLRFLQSTRRPLLHQIPAAASHASVSFKGVGNLEGAATVGCNFINKNPCSKDDACLALCKQ